MNSALPPAVSAGVVQKEKFGEVWAETIESLVGEAIAGASASSHCWILLDFRQAHFCESLSGIYTLPPRLQERGFNFRHKVAIVYTVETAYYEFFETVMRNRGFNNVRVFHSPRDAHEWLR